MIADYEGDGKTEEMASPALYAVAQSHKHLPEMANVCSLDHYPVFSPIVDDYYSGMATTIPVHGGLLKGVNSLKELYEAYADYYKDEALVSLAEPSSPSDKYYGGALSGKDFLKIHISGNDERLCLTALFDNLGKGASGAAIQNMNILLGVSETTGLIV